MKKKKNTKKHCGIRTGTFKRKKKRKKKKKKKKCGWLGRAMVLGTLAYGRAGACCACSRCGTGGLFFFIFFISSILLPFLMSHLLGDDWTY